MSSARERKAKLEAAKERRELSELVREARDLLKDVKAGTQFNKAEAEQEKAPEAEKYKYSPGVRGNFLCPF